MIAFKSLFSYSYLYIFLLFFCFFSFYLFDPFSNECIKGNCENGTGVYVYHSGMKYDGDWKNGKRDGQGTLTYYDGSYYTGGWGKNRMHGKGIKIYISNPLYRKYMGEWKNGNKNGKGTAIYSGGSRYEGYWKDGKILGHGTITTIDGMKITGTWINGNLNGTVTEFYPGGWIVVVEMINGIKNGPGVITSPDGTKITGEWRNNKLVGSLKFYLFRVSEFENRYSITALCKAIRRDIGLSLKAQELTISWLNELLKVPNLYEELNKKTHEFSQEIDTLIEHTNDLRSKTFSGLNIDNQKDIIKLNRLLLEHLYPNKTPKSE